MKSKANEGVFTLTTRNVAAADTHSVLGSKQQLSEADFTKHLQPTSHQSPLQIIHQIAPLVTYCCVMKM